MDLVHFKNLTINNVGLSIVEFREYNKVLKLLNDTSHLKESLNMNEKIGVIGGGPAGIIAAGYAGARGKDVVLIEKKQ